MALLGPQSAQALPAFPTRTGQSPHTPSNISLNSICSQMSLSSVILLSPLNPSGLLTGASAYLIFREGIHFLMALPWMENSLPALCS